MNIKKMTTEELELMSHTDIAYNILKHEKKTLTTIELLKEICSLLNYGDTEYENLIGDFYTSLNVDKRFILIDGKWDLAENHAVKIIIDDEGDDDEDMENYDDEENEDSVKLMTMHNTKGLEFDTVFVTGLEDGIMPSVREGSEIDDVEEERRLFYVAVTRAKKKLFLTFASKRMLWGSWNSQKPSRFLKEIPKNFYKGEIETANSSYTNHFAFEPRRSNITNTPSWAQNIVKTPTKTKSSEVKVVKNVNYEVGDRVISPDYGRGEIISKEIKNGKTVIRVRFEKGNVALFNTMYANLTKVE